MGGAVLVRALQLQHDIVADVNVGILAQVGASRDCRELRSCVLYEDKKKAASRAEILY